jgi:hypothetical protein
MIPMANAITATLSLSITGGSASAPLLGRLLSVVLGVTVPENLYEVVALPVPLPDGVKVGYIVVVPSSVSVYMPWLVVVDVMVGSTVVVVLVGVGAMDVVEEVALVMVVVAIVVGLIILVVLVPVGPNVGILVIVVHICWATPRALVWSSGLQFAWTELCMAARNPALLQ